MKQHYKDLVVWQKAMAQVTKVYRVTKCYSPDERFGLTAQTKKSAVSVPSNIAEGQSRRTRKEFVCFLGIAKGSLMELETPLLIAQNLSYLSNPHPILDQLGEVARLLNGLINSLSDTPDNRQLTTDN